MRLLILDNYDSFTYNIVHASRRLGFNPEVFRNDEIALDDVEHYDKIIISPGPGIPSEAGVLPALLERYASIMPILGICLGEQAIGERFGCRLVNMKEVCHGISSPITVTADDYLFHGLPERFEVGRYHSWAIDPASLTPEIEVTAITDDGVIMAVRHKTLDVRGVQFHPESVLTPNGNKILSNWLNH